MTISTAVSAPIIAVVGATGAQGGSVIRALSESNKAYRIRGFTRNITKASAQALTAQGVEMVAVNLVVENRHNVYSAFVGADYAFLVTNFWEHADKQKEIAEGKLLIDAAKAAGVKGIIFSGLTAVEKLSKGKYTKVFHFDGKAEVAEYGRASGVPFVDVQAGFYNDNFLSEGLQLVTKNSDGTFILSSVIKPSAVIPLIDVEKDYGLYVCQVLEAPIFPDGSVVYARSEDLSMEEVARQLSEGLSKTVTYQQITYEEATQSLTKRGFPEITAIDIVEGFLFFSEFGYYGRYPAFSAEGLGRPPSRFSDFVKAADWSKVFL
ncbi:NmrA domain-containing protein [Favolaschia claudopus]|uniref:NmrA domain-containing protein n=1 Tax=Favolaschia claudopus TaxID=2862362 RepID=A0AAW0CDD2_9AGAR